MIPLMVQKDYKPKGWLGMILGTRMWTTDPKPKELSSYVLLM